MSKPTVLLVDDDEAIRRVAELTLAHLGGWEVRTVTSGPAALDALAATELPDVVLLDMMMPGMDGAEVFRRIRADPRTADVPVVFMTAKAQAHEVRGYVELGVKGVIAKPFDPMTMNAQLRGILDAG